jgi:hypothetical protein
MPRRRPAGVLVALLALAPGCASRRPDAVPAAASPAAAAGGEPTAPRRPVTLRVVSRHLADVVVYAEQGGQRQRIGTVVAATTQRLLVPSRFTRDGAAGFTLVADPVGGGRAVRSDRLLPQAGQRIVWTLESDLSRSLAVLEEEDS